MVLQDIVEIVNMKVWIYRHYKNKLYEVLWHVRHSETLEELVLYKALYDSEEFWEKALWVRPKEMFEESVIVDWVDKPRFEYVWDKKYENL